MNIIRFHEKHGTRCFVWHRLEEKRLILAQIAEERLNEGYWYDTENGQDQLDLLRPYAHLSDAETIGLLLAKLHDPAKRKGDTPVDWYLNQIERWMTNRRKNQYENWEIEMVEEPALEISGPWVIRIAA